MCKRRPGKKVEKQSNGVCLYSEHLLSRLCCRPGFPVYHVFSDVYCITGLVAMLSSLSYLILSDCQIIRGGCGNNFGQGFKYSNAMEIRIGRY